MCTFGSKYPTCLLKVNAHGSEIKKVQKIVRFLKKNYIGVKLPKTTNKKFLFSSDNFLVVLPSLLLQTHIVVVVAAAVVRLKVFQPKNAFSVTNLFKN